MTPLKPSQATRMAALSRTADQLAMGWVLREQGTAVLAVLVDAVLNLLAGLLDLFHGAPRGVVDGLAGLLGGALAVADGKQGTRVQGGGYGEAGGVGGGKGRDGRLAGWGEQGEGEQVGDTGAAGERGGGNGHVRLLVGWAAPAGGCRRARVFLAFLFLRCDRRGRIRGRAG